jgi:hypothetical protein
MYKRETLLLTMLLAGCLISAGCSSTETQEEPTPEPVKKEEKVDERAELAKLVAYYRLDQVQVAVVSREALDEQGLGDELAQRFREDFSELGMRVQNAGGAELPETSATAIKALAGELDADLLLIALGKAKQRDDFGGMLSFEATVRGTVYEARGGVVATKELRKIGKRSSDASLAKSTALRAACEQLGPFLVKQIVRKVGQNVVARRLTVRGLRNHSSARWIEEHLGRQKGINDVRPLSWDEESGTGRWLVYLQPAVRSSLGQYVAKTPFLDMKITADDREGTTGEERREDR